MSSCKPYVIVYVTESVDGRIASKVGYSRFSCKYDLIRLHKVRAEVDAIVVGANTVIRDDPLLTVRYVETYKQPIRVIIDGYLRIPLNSRVITDKTSKTVIFTSGKAPKDKVDKLRSLGIQVFTLDEGPLIRISDVLNVLCEELGIRKVLVEGGGTLLWHFFKEGLVDEVRVTISPYVVGGVDAISMVMGEGFNDERDLFRLELIKVEICRCGGEVHIVYKKA